jgi:hypothetical protein
MKKLQLVLFLAISVFCFAGLTFAATLTFNDYDYTIGTVASNASAPVFWAWLDFPASAAGNYPDGSFEYDAFVGQLTLFKITLYGRNDNSNETIDIYLDFNSDHSEYSEKIASKNVDTNPFTLTLDIKNNRLLYNGVDAGVALSGGIGPSSFVGADEFWVGYACHFTHKKTGVEVWVNSVPESSTIILLCSGVIGLLGFRKKFRP